MVIEEPGLLSHHPVLRGKVADSIRVELRRIPLTEALFTNTTLTRRPGVVLEEDEA